MDDSVETDGKEYNRICIGRCGMPTTTNRNFSKYFEHRRIKPRIKIRKNPTIIPSINDNSLKNREVYSQIKDLFKWKKIIRYGQR